MTLRPRVLLEPSSQQAAGATWGVSDHCVWVMDPHCCQHMPAPLHALCVTPPWTHLQKSPPQNHCT